MQDKVLEFIERRFPVDCNWTTGNCYYFALILSKRFNGDIYYDGINSHFVSLIDDTFYDYNGAYEYNESLIYSEELLQKDPAHYIRLIRDCMD